MRRIRKLDKKDKNEHENTDELTQEEIHELNDIELEITSKANSFEKVYNLMINIGSVSVKIIKFLIKTSGVYLLWISLHYFSAQLYIKFCVPNTLVGFIMSPFMISTPHCQGLRWIVYNAANIINNMWILIGAWIYSIIWIFNKENATDTSNVL